MGISANAPGAACVDDIDHPALAINELGGGKPFICKNFRPSENERIFDLTTRRATTWGYQATSNPLGPA